jgi:L-rhamnose mutarotase
MRARLRLAFPPLLAAMTAGALAAAEPAGKVSAPRGEPVVELPAFEVRDTRILPLPESWRYSEVPGFEILSKLSERETRRFVNDFLLLQQVIEIIMPGLTRGQVAVPTALILCGRGNGFEEFLPTKEYEDRYFRNSQFFKNQERAAIVVDFALPELRFNDQETIESDPYRAFYIEYFRFLIRKQLTQAPPAWFEEGLVQLFGAIDFTKKWIVFGQIGDGFGATKIGDFNQVLSRRAIMPMGEMLKHEGPRNRSRYWQAQCYAFVHMCLYGANQKYQKGFVQFVTRLGSEPLSEQLFKECFGRTYKQMALELRGHCEFTVYKAMHYTAKKGQQIPEPPAITLRDATDAEVGRIKGEVLRLGGHGEKALNALIAPYVRGERDPRLLAALGLDELQAGRPDRARKFLEAAAQAKVVRARAHLELARLRLEEAREKPAAPPGPVRLRPGHARALAPFHRDEAAAGAGRGLYPGGRNLGAVGRAAAGRASRRRHRGDQALPPRHQAAAAGGAAGGQARLPRGGEGDGGARGEGGARQRRAGSFPHARGVAGTRGRPRRGAGGLRRSRGGNHPRPRRAVPAQEAMIRKAFVMSVHPGAEAEYARRHQPIWRELEDVLRAHGVHNYSIFLHADTRQLFAYAEIEDEARWEAIAQTGVCQRWWKHMADVMPANPDHSPVATGLKEVFHLD